MLYMSQAGVSRRIMRWAWHNRPISPLDNPVKRYLGNRSVGPGLWKWLSQWIRGGRLILRPAI